MNYTSSDAYAVDAGTGQRMHLAAQAVPTQVTDQDLNSVIWSLMELVKACGLTGIDFNKNTPESYQQLLQSIRRIGARNVLSLSTAGPHNLTADDCGLILVDASAANVAINLPVIGTLGRHEYRIARTDASLNTVTINRSGSNLIFGQTSVALAGQYSLLNVMSMPSGNTWWPMNPPASSTPDQLIGAILFSASTTPVLPPNCLACNGAAFNPVTYPVLAARYPAYVTPNIPDGFALIQGITGFGNLWAGAVQSHAHTVISPVTFGFDATSGGNSLTGYPMSMLSGYTGGVNNYAAGQEGYFYIVAK